KLADSEFFIKLLDETGQLHQTTSAQLEPEFSPYLAEADQILVFRAPLNLPADMPLGVYKLELGLRLKATGEETWNFPLTNLANTITVNRGALNVSAEALSIQHRLEQAVDKTGLTLLGYDDPIVSSLSP